MAQQEDSAAAWDAGCVWAAPGAGGAAAVPRVYVGSVDAAQDAAGLRAAGITHVLTVAAWSVDEKNRKQNQLLASLCGRRRRRGGVKMKKRSEDEEEK